MSDWDLLIRNARIATMVPGERAYGTLDRGALAVSGNRIAWVGPESEIGDAAAQQTVDAGQRWLTPALIDCHTHLVFAGNRAAEFEERLNGATYEEISRAGGGIMSTVQATRSAGAEHLREQAAQRMRALRNEGVATVEIKSGYGLDLDTKLRMLKVARDLAADTGMRVTTTYLGAHALPPEFDGRPDDYIDYVAQTVLPQIVERSLADAVDAFCERIAFSATQIEKVFDAARAHGLPVKLHADQLSDGGGAELASRFDALSADHIEYASRDGLNALQSAGSVAVLLPGAFLTLKESQKPPVGELREVGIPIAVASDLNPGSSPICSLQINLSLACSQFDLTPEESLAGATREAARALGLEQDLGTLETGKLADLAIWNFEHPRELCYWMGLNPLHQLYIGGQPVDRE